jgi:hypothetical protein
MVIHLIQFSCNSYTQGGDLPDFQHRMRLKEQYSKRPYERKGENFRH